MPESRDVLARVAALAPDADSLANTEWPAGDRRRLLAQITGRAHPTNVSAAESPLTRPHRESPAGRRRALPVAAGIATVAATAGILLAVRGTGTGDPSGAGGPAFASSGGAPALARPFNPPTGLSTEVPGGNMYYYHVDRQIDLDAQGKALPNGPDAMLDRNWIRADGGGPTVSIRTGSQNGCARFPRTSDGSFDNPTRAFFASLPTDTTRLAAYLRSHTDGSSSKNEAVFVAVGDSLSVYGGLASPRLRAAMLAVLSSTPGVRVFLGQQDDLRRPAIRADFVDQRIRPGQVQSYYFDPTDFRFVEERSSQNSRPSAYSGPSAPYTAAAPSNANDPEQLGRAGYVDVVVSEQMVRTLPAEAASCSGSLIDRNSTPSPATS